MADCVVSEHIHDHPLEWNKKREFYKCEACKREGHGPSYDCNHCKLKFHGDCATAHKKLRHAFFPTTELHLITVAAAKRSNQSKKCTACGTTIRGTAHGSKTMGVYFHPCCAMMPNRVQALNMVLIREASSDSGTEVCGICDGAFDGQWVYCFPTTGRHAHAWCVMHEQGHAMNLVDSNLPFDNPDPVKSNIDGQMRSLNINTDNMGPPPLTPRPQGPQESQSRSVPPSEGSRNYSAGWVPPEITMPYPAGSQNYGVPNLYGHGHGHGGPNWNTSAPHGVQPGLGNWPGPPNYWVQNPPGMSAGGGTPMPTPPFNAVWGSTWGSAPYAWPLPAHLPYHHAGAGWNLTPQVPPGGQAPPGPSVGGQASPAQPPQSLPPSNAAGDSIWGKATRWGFKTAMLALGIADLATD